MTSLALHTRPPPPHEQDSQRQNRLRDSALWYPTIPPRNLCLNEEAFTPRAFYTAGFKPLFWCHFGGPRGKYLPHLTGVTVTSCVGILRIRFSFDTPVPAEHRSFGRRKFGDEEEEVVHFPIDGRDGERLDVIKIRHSYPRRAVPWSTGEGYMDQCEVCPVPQDAL